MCTELAFITCRIWTFRSLEIGFVIEPNTFIGITPLEKGNLHESAVRKTIGLSPEGNLDMAAGLPSGSAPKQGLIAHGRRIRHTNSAPIRLIRTRKLPFPVNRLLPCLPVFFLPLDAARSSGCLRPIDIGLNGMPPQIPAAGRPQKQISNRHSFEQNTHTTR